MSKSRIKQYVDEGPQKLSKLVLNLWKQTGYNFSKSDIEKNMKMRLKGKDVIDKDGKVIDAVGYWQSILHSLEIGAFLNTHKSVADDIVNTWYQGATSTGGMSSEFIKVY
jgi:ribosomal protein S16